LLEGTMVEVSFSEMRQQGWGTAVALESALSSANNLYWQTVETPVDSVRLLVDDVRILE
jgi:hypothetical protein